MIEIVLTREEKFNLWFLYEAKIFSKGGKINRK